SGGDLPVLADPRRRITVRSASNGPEQAIRIEWSRRTIGLGRTGTGHPDRVAINQAGWLDGWWHDQA
ncbi:MAG: hypothetical protein ABMA64_20130, partial [Myxococcota bacterium]